MRKITITFETNSASESLGILEGIQQHQSSSEVKKPINALAKAKQLPPPVPNKKLPPPVPQTFDEKKARVEIGDELTRIMNKGGNPRSLLTDNGYSNVREIPTNNLLSFLEGLKRK